MGKKKITFEDSLKRLQEISEKLESEEISLDESVKLYEEGIELSKNCFNELNNAELKVKELKKQLEIELNNSSTEEE